MNRAQARAQAAEIAATLGDGWRPTVERAAAGGWLGFADDGDVSVCVMPFGPHYGARHRQTDRCGYGATAATAVRRCGGYAPTPHQAPALALTQARVDEDAARAAYTDCDTWATWRAYVLARRARARLGPRFSQEHRA